MSELDAAIMRIATLVTSLPYERLKNVCLTVASHYPMPVHRTLDQLYVDIASARSTLLADDFHEAMSAWEHTFTSHSYTSAQATDTMTADKLLKLADDIKDLRPQELLEEYEQYSRASMNKLIYAPYMRYLAWSPQIEILPAAVRMQPFLAEGLSASERHALYYALCKATKRDHRIAQARKRKRRQHRAAFRRRKRGLA